MRVNVYGEELTDRVEIVSKVIEGREYTGLRIYLELPVTLPDKINEDEMRQVKGPFIHHEGDDDSSAITFWGNKQYIRLLLQKSLTRLDDFLAMRMKEISSVRDKVE